MHGGGASRLTIALVVLLGAVTGGRAQQRPPATPPVPGPQATFRTGVDLVQVDVAVLDSNRRPARGLTQADFTLYEDGKPRPIVAFSAVELPEPVVSAAAPDLQQAPPDIVTNQIQEEGRLVIILLDRSIPQGQPESLARKIAAAAINQLGPGDLGAIASTNHGMPQNLTSDRARLLRAVMRMPLASEVSQETQEVGRESASALGLPSLTALQDGRCYCGVCVPETIQHIADSVRDVTRRRKVLLFIGASLTLQASDSNCAFLMKDAREAMFRSLDRASLTIHSIDPSGLETLAPSAASAVRATGARQSQSGAVMRNLERQGEIAVLPARTGGRTILNTSEPDRFISAIFHESDSYYLLGFEPTVPGPLARFHKIEVKVNRRGLKVQTRHGYETPAAGEPSSSAATGTAANAPAAAAPAGLLERLLPTSPVPLELSVAPFAGGTPPRHGVAVVVGLPNLADEAGAKPAGDSVRYEVVAGAYDALGRPVASSRQTLEIAPTAASRADFLSRLDLKPGDYEVRVSVTGPDPARASSVFGFVEVPRFDSDRLSLSGLVIGTDPAITAAPRDFLAALVPVVPTAARAFARTARAGALVGIYQGTGLKDPLQPVNVRARILRGAESLVQDVVTLAPSAFGPARATAYQIELPLALLVPGDYTIAIDASMGAMSGVRAARFTVK